MLKVLITDDKGTIRKEFFSEADCVIPEEEMVRELEAAIRPVLEKDRLEGNASELLPAMTKAGSKFVPEAIKYIAEHYSENDIGIASVARALRVSESHLSHVFKKETNYTVIDYLTRYRVYAAMKFLQDCRYKVYEVSELVGYKDPAYFASTFKRLTGVSPSKYQDKSR